MELSNADDDDVVLLSLIGEYSSMTLSTYAARFSIPYFEFDVI